jgi:hypothetical protein
MDGLMNGRMDAYELAYNSIIIFFRELKNRIFHFCKTKMTLVMNGKDTDIEL